MKSSIHHLGSFCEYAFTLTIVRLIDVLFDIPAPSWAIVGSTALLLLAVVSVYLVARVVARFRAERQITRATGAELDALVEHLGIRRKVESDDELRERARREIAGPR